MRLLGAVLAGGASTRFGSDKAIAELDGRPLIEHAIAALGRECEAVIVCGRNWGDWVPDRPRSGLGPLGGIAAALHTAAERGFDAVLSCGCDTPLLPDGLGARLAAAGPAAFVAELPVIGFWPAGHGPLLDAFLAESDDRSVRAWARVAGAVPLALGGRIANVNRREDLARVRAR